MVEIVVRTVEDVLHQNSPVDDVLHQKSKRKILHGTDSVHIF